MERTLVQQGPTSLMVSLPIKWLRQQQLSKGDSIDITQSQEGLVLTSAKRKKKEIHITLQNNVESSIRALLANAYRAGYAKIHLTAESEEQIRHACNIVKTRLIGFEITQRTNHECIAESVTEPSPDQFDNLLRKIFLTIDELFFATTNALGGRKQSAREIDEIEERVQRYDHFCRRVIAKGKLINQKSECTWTFLALIMHAQHELYHLCKTNPKKATPQTQILLVNVKKTFEFIRTAYEQKDTSALEKLHALEKKIVYSQGYRLLRRGNDGIVVYHLLAAARQFYLANSPLTGMLM